MCGERVHGCGTEGETVVRAARGWGGGCPSLINAR